MRVAIVDTYYPRFLQAHYAGRPELADAPYRDQMDALLARHMGTGDSYSAYLEKHGHVATELVANCVPVQRAWLRDRGDGGLIGRLPGRLGRQSLLRRAIHAQLRALQPDVVYVQDMGFFTRPELDLLRRHGCIVVGQIASATPSDRIVRGYDLVITSFPHFVPRFRALGVDSEYLPIAFDSRVPEILEQSGIGVSPAAPRPHDVAFVGGLTAEHDRGTAVLERLAERFSLSVWGYGADHLAPDSPLRARHRGEAWGLDMYAILARSKVVVNRHINAAEGYANNMRMYEATGSGALLVTEHAPNLGELFEPGVEVLAYRDEQELVELIERQLCASDERVQIAAAGQSRTLRDHTYEKRIGELASLLERRVHTRR
jgi:hypothetical protein